MLAGLAAAESGDAGAGGADTGCFAVLGEDWLAGDVTLTAAG